MPVDADLKATMSATDGYIAICKQKHAFDLHGHRLLVHHPTGHPRQVVAEVVYFGVVLQYYECQVALVLVLGHP